MMATESATNRTHEFDDYGDEHDTSNSSFNEINFEIQRMSLKADEILESIRNEANSNHQRKVNHLVETSESEDEDVISASRFLASAVASGDAAVTMMALKQSQEEENDDDDEDDDMLDELARLESVTAEIQEAMKSDDMNIMSSPILIRNIKKGILNGDEDEEEFPDFSLNKEVVKRSLKKSQERLEQALGKEGKPSKSPYEMKSIRDKIVATTKKVEQKLASFAHSSSTSLFDLNVDDGDDLEKHIGREDSLLIAVTLVWSVVLIVVVHGKFFLVDEGGLVKLPFFR